MHAARLGPFALGVCLTLSACTASYREKVLDLATGDLQCPRGEIRIVDRGALAFSGSSPTVNGDSNGTSTFRVDAVGCARSSAYACTRWTSVTTSYTCCNMASPGCY